MFKKSSRSPGKLKITKRDKPIVEIKLPTKRKNEEVIIVRKSDPIIQKPSNGLKKLDVIIISVNYNDYLIVSLSNNVKIFDNITVVTSPDDLMCQKICEKFGVNCLVTNVMYENGANFNKGKAINKGIESIVDPNFILLLDADIVITDKIDIDELIDDNFYISDRWICRDYNFYKRFIDGEIEISDIGKCENNKGLGFFQLFNINNNSIDKSKVFPEISDDAAWSDLMFRDKFTKRKTIKNDVIHLGDPYMNWNGRRTNRFLTDDDFISILNNIEKSFDINKYFDRIYCLNLKSKISNWEKVRYQLNEKNIYLERFEAIDGNEIEDELFYNIDREFNPKGLRNELASRYGIIENKFSYACLLSHIKILKDAKDKGYKKILILEDDVIISDNFLESVKNVKNINWKLIYLGCSQFDWEDISINDGFYKSKNTLGTFAYGVDYSIFNDLIDTLERKNKSVDNLLSDYQKVNEDCYTLFPNIIISNVSESEIRSSKSIVEYSKIVRWNLNEFSNISYLERIKSTTIIIPCYGHSKYLDECIDSCLSQSIKPGKILVLLMDEDSILMKNKIENKSNIINCIISGKMKLSEARNLCVDKIETEYFIPIDADDKIPENFIEEICKIESDVVYIGSEYFGSQSGVWPDPITEEINWTKLTTFRRNSLVCTALIKKESFVKSGKYKEVLWAFEDMDLWIRMYKNGFTFKKCFNTKLLYRKHFLLNSLLSQANSNEESKKDLKRLIMNDDFYKRTPKIIHWVWIGNNPIPKEVVETWKKNLPEGEWEYMLWNENNFDMNSCEFLRKSYESKKYGICVDYIRAKVLYEYGGVWLDADCLITNDISPFLQYDFFGSWENINYLNIGLIGCSPKMDIIKRLVDYYTNINIDDDIIKTNHRFINEIGTGPMVLTNELMKIKNIINGGFTNDFIFNNKKYLIETPDVFVLDDSKNGRINYAIHLFDGSWTEKKEKWSDVVFNYYESWKLKNNI
jgi:GR25 family glycosyltransferase involved in LPS biosynthesis/mannosyltransferase OCH1-like enzyme